MPRVSKLSRVRQGTNYYGQIGTNSTVSPIKVPTEVVGGGSWTSIGVGNSHSCAIATSTRLYCWVGLPAPGSRETCLVRFQADAPQLTNYNRDAQGNNINGQLGVMSQGPRKIPTEVYASGWWYQVSLGWTHTCGVRTDYGLWCWVSLPY